MSSLKNKKIVITGVAGLIARPCAEMLAADNEVWGVSRFDESEADARKQLEALGIHCVPWDLSEDVPAELPEDATHILHASVLRATDNYDDAINLNSLAVTRLMFRFRRAEAFAFLSSCAIYKRLEWDHRHKETDPLGGGIVFIPAYQVSKIAAEGVVRSLCAFLEIPTIILRPNVCYGPHSWGGVPILFLKKMLAGEPIEAPPGAVLHSMPIHTDDFARMMPALWGAATTPATIVNMAGDVAMTDPEYLDYISEITGVPLRIEPNTEYHRDMFLCDNSRRESIAGSCQVDWRVGMAQVIEAHFPGLIKQRELVS